MNRLTALINRLTGRMSLHPALERNRAAFASFTQNTALESCEFVIADTELTGLNASRDEIVAIGAVRIRNLSIVAGDTFYTIVRPERGQASASTLIHRITPAQMRDMPPVADVLPDFLDFCGNALLVGHHVGLDMSFISRACKKHLGGAPATPCIDTMRLAQAWERERWEKSFDPFQPTVSYTLADLAKRYGLPAFRDHDALEDALQTAYLFLYLVRKLRGGGISTLKELYDAGRGWRWYL